MLRGALRALLVLLPAALALIAVLSPGPGAGAEAAPPAPPPAPPMALPDCGANAVPMAGTIRVSGSPVRGAVGWTSLAPEEVLACQRRHFEALPVDLVAIEGGLSIHDNLGGRTLIVTARRIAKGSTEVVLGERSPEAIARRPQAPADLPLPPVMTPASVVEDGSGLEPAVTISGTCSAPPQEAARQLEQRLAPLGFRATALAPAGADVARHLIRGATSILAVLAAAPGGCAFTIRRTEHREVLP